MKLNVRGLDGVLEQLRAVGAELGRDALAKAARQAFKRVADTAKQLAPVDSGAMRDAISVRTAKPRTGDAVVAAGIVISGDTTRMKQARVAAAAFGEAQTKRLPPARRWHFIEFGTAKQAARPFLRPALDANAQGVVDDLSEKLKRSIAQAVKSASRGTK